MPASGPPDGITKPTPPRSPRDPVGGHDTSADGRQGGGGTPNHRPPGDGPPGEPACDPGGGGQIGRYRLVELLGEGGFGQVYRGYDPDLRREVAIKVPVRQHLTTQVREWFLREARAAATIHHPSVCPIYDVGTDGDLPYIVMRFVPTGTLAGLLARRASPLPPRHAAAIARRLALGVAAAHAEGIVHRDLKPQNVLWDEALRQVLVTDFGIARQFGEATLNPDRKPMGTPGYMAPEQARGDNYLVGPLSDVYALGVILYEMLAGRLPFDRTWPGYLWHVTQDAPKPPSAMRPGLDPRLDAICQKAMARTPADRYPFARDLADALAAVLGDGKAGDDADLVFAEEIAARPAPPAPRPPAPKPVKPPPSPPPPAEVLVCPKCRARLQVRAGRAEPVTCPMCSCRFAVRAGRQAAGRYAAAAQAAAVTIVPDTAAESSVRNRVGTGCVGVMILLLVASVLTIVLSRPPDAVTTPPTVKVTAKEPPAPPTKATAEPPKATFKVTPKTPPPVVPGKPTPPPGWKEYTPTDGSFTAYFPTTPERTLLILSKTKAVTTGKVKLGAAATGYASKGDHPTDRCVLVVVRLPTSMPLDEREAAMSAAVAKLDFGKSIEPPPAPVKAVDWLGGKAREAEVNPKDATAPNARFVTRRVIVGNTGYVGIVGVRDARGSDVAARFFNTVTLPVR